jgi:hypothetical protein
LPAGEQGFADTASRSRSQPKMEDNLFTSPYGLSLVSSALTTYAFIKGAVRHQKP